MFKFAVMITDWFGHFFSIGAGAKQSFIFGQNMEERVIKVVTLAVCMVCELRLPVCTISLT